MIGRSYNHVNLILKLKLSKDKASSIRYKVLTNATMESQEYEQKYHSLPAEREIKGFDDSKSSGYSLLSSNKESPLITSSNDNQYIDIEHDDYDDFIKQNPIYDLNNKNGWPHKTNLRCWFCTLYFNTVPCAKPIKYENGVFTVVGCFCSFNCIIADVLDSRDTQKWEICGLINLMYNKIYCKNKNIKPSPNKKVLKEYGGELTRDEYRKSLNDSIITYEILLPPVTNIGYTIQKIDRQLDKSNKKSQYIPLNFKKIDSAVKSIERFSREENKNDVAIDNFIRIKQ